MMHAREQEAGYSLVELVVALLLLGMIALACESGLHFGAQVWTRSQDRIAAAHRINTAQSVLRSLLSHSLPRLKGDYVTFVGGPKTLSFDSVPPQAFQAHGTAHVTLEVARIGASERLVLSMQSVLDPRPSKKAVLLESAVGLSFSYLDDSGASGTWLAYWRDRKRLPEAIQVTSADPTRWPTLVVRPVIAQSATCSLDPVSMTCRKT